MGLRHTIAIIVSNFDCYKKMCNISHAAHTQSLPNVDPVGKLWCNKKLWDLSFNDITTQTWEGRARWNKHMFRTRTMSSVWGLLNQAQGFAT